MEIKASYRTNLVAETPDLRFRFRRKDGSNSGSSRGEEVIRKSHQDLVSTTLSIRLQQIWTGPNRFLKMLALLYGEGESLPLLGGKKAVVHQLSLNKLAT